MNFNYLNQSKLFRPPQSFSQRFLLFLVSYKCIVKKTFKNFGFKLRKKIKINDIFQETKPTRAFLRTQSSRDRETMTRLPRYNERSVANKSVFVGGKEYQQWAEAMLVIY